MTTSVVRTYQSALDEGNLNQLDVILKNIDLGTVLTPLKRVFTGLTASATMDLTAIDGTGETVGASNAKRLGALCVMYLRVDASGTGASVGNYVVGPPTSTLLVPPGGANVAIGCARISDDGKTLTFPNTITGFTIQYIPLTAVLMSTALPLMGP